MLSRDPGLRNQTELLENLSDNVSNNNVSTFVDIDGQTRNIRWVESQLDELDIEIALQHFEEAVAKVEKLKTLSQNMRGNEMAKKIVTFKVNERAAKLANVLVRQLAEGNTWNGPVGQHVKWVNRLGFEDRAREAYLEARSSMIKARSRYDCPLQNKNYLLLTRTQAMHIRRQLARLHLPDLLHLLPYHQEHRLHVPDLLPAAYHVGVRQVGERAC